MVENGLVDELEQFARCHGVESPDGARGDVRQAIGYAEWMPYLRAKVQTWTRRLVSTPNSHQCVMKPSRRLYGTLVVYLDVNRHV